MKQTQDIRGTAETAEEENGIAELPGGLTQAFHGGRAPRREKLRILKAAPFVSAVFLRGNSGSRED